MSTTKRQSRRLFTPDMNVRQKLSGRSPLLCGLGVAIGVFLGGCSLVPSEPSGSTPRSVATTVPPPAIPAQALHAYARMGSPCEGIDWAVLAGIGKVESDHGRIFGGTIDEAGLVSPLIYGPALDGSGAGGNVTPQPIGEWEGAYGLKGPWLQAVGPMQFLPKSFELFGVDGNGDDVLDPHNMFDAVASAANLLCSAELKPGQEPADLILSYNRSTEYQQRVLSWAEAYRSGTADADTPTPPTVAGDDSTSSTR